MTKRRGARAPIVGLRGVAGGKRRTLQARDLDPRTLRWARRYLACELARLRSDAGDEGDDDFADGMLSAVDSVFAALESLGTLERLVRARHRSRSR